MALIARHSFCATMQLRTPLKVLAMHGALLPAGHAHPPVEEAWHGIWVPLAPTWADLGLLGIPDFMPSTMASDIGPIPIDGGDYLVFLKLFRAIVEERPTKTDAAAVQALVDSSPSFHAFALTHGGVQAMLKRASG